MPPSSHRVAARGASGAGRRTVGLGPGPSGAGVGAGASRAGGHRAGALQARVAERLSNANLRGSVTDNVDSEDLVFRLNKEEVNGHTYDGEEKPVTFLSFAGIVPSIDAHPDHKVLCSVQYYKSLDPLDTTTDGDRVVDFFPLGVIDPARRAEMRRCAEFDKFQQTNYPDLDHIGTCGDKDCKADSAQEGLYQWATCARCNAWYHVGCGGLQARRIGNDFYHELVNAENLDSKALKDEPLLCAVCLAIPGIGRAEAQADALAIEFSDESEEEDESED